MLFAQLPSDLYGSCGRNLGIIVGVRTLREAYLLGVLQRSRADLAASLARILQCYTAGINAALGDDAHVCFEISVQDMDIFTPANHEVFIAPS